MRRVRSSRCCFSCGVTGGSLVMAAGELFLGLGVGAAIELVDEGAELAGAVPGGELAHVLVNDRDGGVDGGGALAGGGGGDFLEVVEVVEVDVFEFADGGVDVAGDGDVDEEDGFVAAGRMTDSKSFSVMMGCSEPVEETTMSARARWSESFSKGAESP